MDNKQQTSKTDHQAELLNSWHVKLIAASSLIVTILFYIEHTGARHVFIPQFFFGVEGFTVSLTIREEAAISLTCQLFKSSA